MNGEWAIWKNAFSKEECEDYVERGKDILQTEGYLGSQGEYQNKETRRSKVKWIHDDLYSDLFTKMWKLTRKVNPEFFGFHIDDLRYMQLTEYDESYKGEYKVHHDVFWMEPIHRKLSVVLQLTDPTTYTGGDLGLQVQGESPKDYKDQGTVIWFPSWTPHWVTPVTKGRRNSIVCWFEGPHWK